MAPDASFLIAFGKCIPLNFPKQIHVGDMSSGNMSSSPLRPVAISSSLNISNKSDASAYTVFSVFFSIFFSSAALHFQHFSLFFCIKTHTRLIFLPSISISSDKNILFILLPLLNSPLNLLH